MRDLLPVRASGVALAALALAGFTLAAVGPAAATDFDGGTETVHITDDNGAGLTSVSFTFKNATGVPIHDFIISVVPRPIPFVPLDIAEVRESNTAANTDFDVDDNGNNTLEAGESATAGGAEMAGDADNQPPAAAGTVRTINAAGSPDITNNDTFGLDITFSGPLVACDKIKFTPTNLNGFPILNLANVQANGVDGAKQVALEGDYLLRPAGALTLVNALSEPLQSLSLCALAADVVQVRSPGARVREDEAGGRRRLTLEFPVPVAPGETFELDFELDRFGSTPLTLVNLVPNSAPSNDPTVGPDFDEDRRGDCADNCPGTFNPDQQDGDGDGIGDLCDLCPADAANDEDADGLCANFDNCPLDPNPDQLDTDGDGAGDACDACSDPDSACMCDFRLAVEAAELPPALSRSLMGRLESAMERRAAGQDRAAQRMLEAMHREIERRSGGAMTGEEAAALLAAMEAESCLVTDTQPGNPQNPQDPNGQPTGEDPYGGTQDEGGSTPAAGDTNRIDINYDPSMSEVSSPCDTIYFIQVMQILVDGNPVDPGDFYSGWQYRDQSKLDDSSHVDRLAAGSTPYYGGDGAGTGHSAPGSRNGGSTPATMDDTPRAPDDWFMPGGSDAAGGTDFAASEITYKFETCAFCAAGEDVGWFFDCITWEFTRTAADVAAGSPGTSSTTGGSSQPSQTYRDAVQAWDDAHEGFNLPPG